MKINIIKNFYKKAVSCIIAAGLIINVGDVNVSAGEFTDNLILQYNDEIYKYQDRLITVEIDGEELTTGDMPAVLIDDRTMVPVREVFESASIDAQVTWLGATEQVILSYADKYVVLTIDASTAYVNNEPVELSVPAMLIKDMSKEYPKTMIPLRFVSESLGFDVTWDAESFTAGIETNKTTSETISTGSSSSDSSSEDSTVAIVDPDDDSDTVKDATVVSGEQLDKLEGTKANRTLPTGLLSNPVTFLPDGDVDEQVESSYSEIDIEAKNYKTTKINDIDYIERGDDIGFRITAKDKISDVSTHVWDGKFIIEIMNAEVDLDETTIDYKNNPIVTAVRIGEHESDEGEVYTKIVFDLKTSGYKFNLDLSDDRETLEVVAVNNSIYNMELGQNEKGDYIDITGVNATVVEAFRLTNPTRIVFDMPNTKTLLGYQESEAEGQYVTAIRTAQFEATTTRIVVETDGQPDYQVLEVSDNVTRIQIIEPTYENISYDNTEDNPTIVIGKDDDGDSFTVDNITYEDYYQEREYVITIPGDYRDYFGSSNVNVNDTVIDYISIDLNNSGDTELTIKAKTIHEFRIEDSDEGLVIKAYKPHELYSKVMVVDAGHGGDDPGAVIGEYQEKTTTLGTVLELKELLDDETDMKVYYTRLEDTRPSLYERTDLANEVEADFFLSIHCNSFTSNFNGVETLFLPGSDTPGLNSFELAAVFQEVFSENVAIENYKAKQRDNLHVLNATEMPAIILEMGYLSNEYDRSYLADPGYFDNLAYGVYLAIIETFDEYPTGR